MYKLIPAIRSFHTGPFPTVIYIGTVYRKSLFPPYRNICHYWLFPTTLTILLFKKLWKKVYFVCHILYCCMYFKLDLSFFMFAIIFWIRRMVKVSRKVNSDKYFDAKGVFCLVWIEVRNYPSWSMLIEISLSFQLEQFEENRYIVNEWGLNKLLFR
jgi:hypothetical protein